MPICTTRGWFLYLSISRSAPLMSSGLTRIVPRKRSPSSGCSSQRDTIISLCAARIAVPRWRSGMMPRPIGCSTATSTPRSVNRCRATTSGSDPGYCPSGPREPLTYSPAGGAVPVHLVVREPAALERLPHHGAQFGCGSEEDVHARVDQGVLVPSRCSITKGAFRPQARTGAGAGVHPSSSTARTRFSLLRVEPRYHFASPGRSQQTNQPVECDTVLGESVTH